MKSRLVISRPIRFALLLLTLWMASLVPAPVSGQECEVVGYWYCEIRQYYEGGPYTGGCCYDCNGNPYDCWGDNYYGYPEVYAWGACENCERYRYPCSPEVEQRCVELCGPNVCKADINNNSICQC